MDRELLLQAVALGHSSTCDRGDSGCVVARDGRVLATGYACSPPGGETCDRVGHMLIEVRRDGAVHRHCSRTIHAEQRAIAEAARFGIPLGGATFYSTTEPCSTCARLIACVGAGGVIAARSHHGSIEASTILAEAGIPLKVICRIG